MINISDFLSRLSHKPKRIGRDLGCGWILIEFRNHLNHVASIEYGLSDPQNLYFEIVDMNGYVEGDLIPLDSNMRKHVINYEELNDKTIEDITRRIDESLTWLYSMRRK